MKMMLAILLMVPFLAWGACRITKGILFDRDCGGYLKRAADANTVPMAKKELQKALDYMEQNRLTEGYTSVIYKTPDEDVGFWYNNIKTARSELDALTEYTTPLESTNVLMKLRETLLDNGKEGTSLTVPEGISIHPHNTAYFIFGILSLLCFVGGCIPVGRVVLDTL
jgi:hypothetical protein